MKKALRNIVLILAFFIVLAFVLKNSETAREAITPAGAPPIDPGSPRNSDL